MTAAIIPFPLSARGDLCRRQAFYMACRSPAEAEKYLARQVDRQRQIMAKKGVDPERAELDLAGFEGRIRGELWRLVMQGGTGGDAA